MTSEDQEYQELMKSRALLRKEMDDGGVEDLSEDNSEGVGYDAVRQARVAGGAPQAAPDNKSGKLSAAGDTVMAGGAMSGNPYVAGAGLALKTVGMVDDSQRQAEQAKIDSYNKKIMAQRSAIRNFFA
jgi:hypothetical protein